MRSDIVLNRAAQIALACVIGLLIITFFRLPKGYWVIWTIMIIYSVFMPGAVYFRIGQRVIGTLIGLILAFFIIQVIQYNYWLIYFMALLFFALNFSMGVNYAYGVIFVSVVVVLSSDYLLDSSGATQVLLDRMIGTIIGALVVLFVELVFYKITKISEKLIRYKLEEFCSHYAAYIDMLIETIQSNQQNERLSYQSMVDVLKSRAEIESYINDEFMANRRNIDKYKDLILAINHFRNQIAKISFMVQNLKDEIFVNQQSIKNFIDELNSIKNILNLSDISTSSQMNQYEKNESYNDSVNHVFNNLYCNGRYIVSKITKS